MKKTRLEQLTEAVKDIRKRHAQGRAIPAKTSDDKVYGEEIIAKRAKELGVSEDKVRKARQFANPEIGYSPEELEELCRQILDVQSTQPTSRPVFGHTHVLKLLTVPKKKDRLSLQKKAMREGWSVRKLETAITKQYGTRRKGGRRTTIPANLDDLLTELDGMCEEWRRWYKAVSEERAESRESPFQQLSQDLQVELKRTTKTISKTQNLIQKELRQHFPKRESRSIDVTAR